jgi:hypothetical protein
MRSPPSRRSTQVVLTWLISTLGIASTPQQSTRILDAARAGPERIAINDNRVAAGTVRGAVLTVHVEARRGQWHPDPDADPGVIVEAFGMEGASLQIPLSGFACS